MIGIGKFLKEKRKSKNISLQDVSQSIKTNVEILKAIERGDLEFFSEDLSYLSYYIKYYLKYLDVEYNYEEELKEAIKSYREKKIEETSINEININNNIQTKISKNNVDKKQGIRIKDYPFITFIIAAVVILCILLGVVLKNSDSIFNGGPKETPTPTQPIIIPTPTTKPTPLPPTPVPQLNVTKINATNYEVRGFTIDEPVNVKVILNAPRTWTRVLINNIVSNNPKSQIYPQNTEFTVIEKVQNDTIISIHLGLFKDNNIYINDQLLVLDDTIINTTIAHQVNIIFKGE